jgi:hypothetical protein
MCLSVYGTAQDKQLIAGCHAGGRCTGSDYCSACKNCSRCAHCNSGGTCGVCSDRSSRRTPTPSRTPSRSAAPSKPKASQGDNMKGYRIIKGPALNLREGPGTSYTIIEKIDAGEEMIVLKDNNKDWLYVEVVKTKSRGYVARSYVTTHE